MTFLVLLVLAVYILMALVEVPALWGRREARAELWAVAVLMAVGVGLAVPTAIGIRLFPAFKLISAVFTPIGTLLFKIKGG